MIISIFSYTIDNITTFNSKPPYFTKTYNRKLYVGRIKKYKSRSISRRQIDNYKRQASTCRIFPKE